MPEKLSVGFAFNRISGCHLADITAFTAFFMTTMLETPREY